MGSLVEDPGTLWTFFIVVMLTVTILLVAVGAAMVVGHRRLMAAQAVFTGRLVEVQDQERARVSAEVHDDLGAQVALIRTMLNATPGGANRGVIGELSDLSEKIRSLAHRLHPTRVDQVGLGAALAMLKDDLAQELDLAIHLTVEHLGRLNDPKGYAIFRITQEALRNAARHGGATEAWVTLRQRGEHLELEVRDNGSGFVVPATTARGTGGLGLQLMRERAGVVGGTVLIVSSPGHGTVIRGQFPLTESPATHA